MSGCDKVIEVCVCVCLQLWDCTVCTVVVSTCKFEGQVKVTDLSLQSKYECVCVCVCKVSSVRSTSSPECSPDGRGIWQINLAHLFIYFLPLSSIKQISLTLLG